VCVLASVMISLALLWIPNILVDWLLKQNCSSCDQNSNTSSNGFRSSRSWPQPHLKKKTRRGSGRLSLCQNIQTKGGSDLATSGPLLTFRSRFDLLLAYPLTLLLIGSHHSIFRKANLINASLLDSIFHWKLDRLHQSESPPTQRLNAPLGSRL
jgi:hypothetical protein